VVVLDGGFMKVKLSQSAIEKMNGTKMRKAGFRIHVRGIG